MRRTVRRRSRLREGPSTSKVPHDICLTSRGDLVAREDAKWCFRNHERKDIGDMRVRILMCTKGLEATHNSCNGKGRSTIDEQHFRTRKPPEKKASWATLSTELSFTC